MEKKLEIVNDTIQFEFNDFNKVILRSIVDISMVYILLISNSLLKMDVLKSLMKIVKD